MKRNRLEISLAIALVISIVFSLVGFDNECEKIRDSVLRLHILANSDSPEDQQVKLMVRDALLASGTEIFSGKTNVSDAEEILSNEKEKLVETANKVLKENGFDYIAKIGFAEEYFTTRTYEDYTLPAGKYRAIKVVLGEGEGHNWWCVMFPPLCLPAAAGNTEIDLYITKEGGSIIRSKPQYEIRFKLIEIIESIKNKLYN
ncbi:MAG: stage II sporulation protein R [Clostridia bacterium]|nr:stage II sporulation protein R [Clostridia bacterium]